MFAIKILELFALTVALSQLLPAREITVPAILPTSVIFLT